jgi:hypothetical protein
MAKSIKRVQNLKQPPSTSKKVVTISPARTPREEENQLIAASYRLAKEQIDSGVASSQVLTHFLKLGSEFARLDMENLKADIELKKAKVEALQSSKRLEDLYAKAIESMRYYSSGVDDNEA